jgi:two-component system response regulator YesN
MRRIVVFDDEYLTISGIKVMLDKIGADYVIEGSACDGISALKMIEEVKPDIVITDIRMPGMSGLELIEKVKPEYPDMIFILISGFKEFEYARAGLELGVLDYIDKPITREKLQKLVNKVEAEINRKKMDAPTEKRKRAERALHLSLDTLIEKINNSDDNDWREEIERSLSLLKQSGLDLDDYMTQCFRFAVSATEIFYEKWKQYEKTYKAPVFHNLEQMKTYEEVDEYVYIIFGAMFDKIAVRKTGCSHRVISEILNYMNENYSKDFGLNEMAEMVGMNNTYLSILFKDQVGESFIKYLTKVRMNHAKGLLLKGYKVKEVSEMVGYSNYRYFCNIFKREVGVTPMEYKGNTRKK